MSAVPGSPYDSWSYREVQAECKARGLKAVAKKEVLSRQLDTFDKSPQGKLRASGLPRPSIPAPSTLKTATYPPSPSFESEEEEEEEEERVVEEKRVEEEIIEEPEEKPTPTSPYKTRSATTTPTTSPKVTPTKQIRTTALSPRFPTPSKTYSSVPTEKETSLVPGWMIQLGMLILVLLLSLMLVRPTSDEVAVVSPVNYESLQSALSRHASGDKIIQTIKVHQSGKALTLFLVGPTDKGLEVANDIAYQLAPQNTQRFKESNGTLLLEKINTELAKNPTSVIIIDTDNIDRENCAFIGLLLDDTISTKSEQAVFILLADLTREEGEEGEEKEKVEVTHEFVEKALRKRWTDRVAQRIRNVIAL